MNADYASLSNATIPHINNSTLRSSQAASSRFLSVSNSNLNAADLSGSVISNKNGESSGNSFQSAKLSGVKLLTDVVFTIDVDRIKGWNFGDFSNPIDSRDISLVDSGYMPSRLQITPATDHVMAVANVSVEMFGLSLYGPSGSMLNVAQSWGVAGKIEHAGGLGADIASAIISPAVQEITSQLRTTIRQELEAFDQAFGTSLAPSVDNMVQQFNALVNPVDIYDVYSFLFDFTAGRVYMISADNMPIDSSIFINRREMHDYGSDGPWSWEYAGDDNRMKNWSVTYRP